MDYGYHPPVPVSGLGSVSGSRSGSGLHYFSSPFGDTTYSKVFVGGLAWETQSEMLQRYFEQFGEILEAVVISDKNTGRSKGYGFVSFLFVLCLIFRVKDDQYIYIRKRREHIKF